MTDRPIAFSPAMVRALLGGRKTQTRRVLSPQLELQHNGFYHVYNRGGGVVGVEEFDVARCAVDFVGYAVGDRLYVREAWRTSGSLDSIAPRDLPKTAALIFEADGLLGLSWRGKFRQGMRVDFAVEISLPCSPCLGWSSGLSDKVEFRDFNLTEREAPMTDDRLPLAELAAKSGDPDFLRVIAENVLQLIMGPMSTA